MLQAIITISLCMGGSILGALSLELLQRGLHGSTTQQFFRALKGGISLSLIALGIFLIYTL